MATSTLRAGIIVAAVVLGAVVLANAFPGTNAELPRSTPTTTPAVSPTGPQDPSVPPTTAVTLEGAVLQVLNGTTRDGLAGETAACLRGAGAVIPDDNIGEPPEDFAVTTLLFRPGQRPLAELLEGRFFPEARILEDPDEQKPNVQVTVILGADYEPAEECA